MADIGTSEENPKVSTRVGNGSSPLSSQSYELEYTSLRGEILKRIELRHQITQALVVFAGVVFALGLTNSGVALVFPPVAALFALSWVQSDFRIRDIAHYIRETIEPRFGRPGWETCLEERRQNAEKPRWRPIVFSHGGIFIGTQLIAIFIGASQYKGAPAEVALLVISILSVFYVFYLIAKSPSQSDAGALLFKK